MKRSQYYMLEIGLGFVAIFGLFMCIAWYPFMTAVNMGYIMPDAIVDVGTYYAILSFYILASIPCFFIVARMSNAVRRYYRHGDSRYMRRSIEMSAYVLGIDAVLFLIGNIVLHIFSLNVYAVIYYVFVAVALMLVLISKHYLKKQM